MLFAMSQQTRQLKSGTLYYDDNLLHQCFILLVVVLAWTHDAAHPLLCSEKASKALASYVC